MKQELFGTIEGEEIQLYTISNSRGMQVKITNYGATITSIKVPVADGIREVACGFDTLEGYFSDNYKNNSPYFGCTVGRYCSQIKDAKFSINGAEYKLASNAGNNNLHGGMKGFDKCIWSAEIKGEDSLEMKLTSPDGDEGFPGKVDAIVTFRLTNENEIVINYEATTDKKTPLSMTNHTYFNLSGFAESVENHVVQVNASKRMALDETGASTGVVDIAGEVDDLRNGKRIGEVHDAIGDGFEHFYVFDNPKSELGQVAEITSASGDLRLEVNSQEPCMLLYTGKYTSDDLKRESGDQFGKYRGFCCETHRWQNGPNLDNSPGTFTEPNEKFQTQTIFKFKA
ncbi:MAG: galactose mutarotase [Reichenbachiella sp.]